MNATLIVVDFLSTCNLSDPPLGRGGAGPGKYVLALIDHPYGTFRNRTSGDNWYEFRNNHGIQLTVPEFFEVIANRNRASITDQNLSRAVSDFDRRERRQNRESQMI